MDPIIDCRSSPETHHSAADVLQNVHVEVYMDSIIDSRTFLETHHSAADVLQNAHVVSTWIPSRLQLISGNPSFRCGRLTKCWECVCSCDGAVAEGSQNLGMEMPPRVIWISFRDVFHTAAFCSHEGPMSSIHVFWLIDIKVSEAYA